MKHRVAVVQMTSGADLDSNLDEAARQLGEAAAGNAELVLLPEAFAVLEGGPMRSFGETEGEGRIQDFVAEQARSRGLFIVAGTIPLISRPQRAPGDADWLVDGERVRPACLVFNAEGRQIARYDKMHLFDVSLDDQQSSYAESEGYEAGEELVMVDTPAGQTGLSVCYDLRFPELYREYCRRGAELLTVPSAFTRLTGEAHWKSLLRARAIENQCYVLAAAQCGRHGANRETWGHSMIIDPWGTVLAAAGVKAGVTVAEIDLDYLHRLRARMPVARQRKL